MAEGGEPRFELVGDLAVATKKAEEAPSAVVSSGRRVVALEEFGVVVVSVDNKLKAWLVSQLSEASTAHTKDVEGGDRKRVGGSISSGTEIEMPGSCRCLAAILGKATLVAGCGAKLSAIRVYAPLSLVSEKIVPVEAEPQRIETTATRVAVELANRTIAVFDADGLSRVATVQGIACAYRGGFLAVASGKDLHIYSGEEYQQPARQISADKVEFYDGDDEDAANDGNDRRLSSIGWLDDHTILCAYDKGTVVEIPDDIQCAVFNKDSGECVSQPSDLDDCVVPFAPTPFSKLHRLEVATVPKWRCALVIVNVAPDVKLLRADDEWDWHVHEADDETTLTARTPNGQDGQETMVAGITIAPHSDTSKFFFLLSTAGILSCYKFTLDTPGENGEVRKFQPKPLPTKNTATETATSGFAPAMPQTSSSGFSGMPPMATRAPKPFGIPATVGAGSPAADNAFTRTSSFGFGLTPTSRSNSGIPPNSDSKPAAGFAGIPPTSENAPKSSASTGEPAGASSATGFAGIPPMAKSAPKQFAAPAPAGGGFSGIPPMAKTAPKPFGAMAPAPATGFSGIPPMSKIAPKPLGATPAPAPKPAGFAGIPPMSKSAPKPFGAPPAKPSSGFAGIPPMSSGAPKPLGAPAPASAAGFAGIPPMSSSAPKPFGAPAPSPAAGFAGIPPMSKSAPKPFGAPAPSPATGFAGIPPMSSSAPKPFGASTAPAPSATAAFAGIQPMPKSTPKPFGAPAPSPAAGFAGIPPMAASAPKLFGAPLSKPTTGFAGMPPMSSSAPKPFGGTPAPAPKPAASGFAGIPPMSSVAPKAFGKGAVATKPSSSFVSPASSSGTSNPFGAASTSKSANAGFAGIPPMSKTAPKPPSFSAAPSKSATEKPRATQKSADGASHSLFGASGAGSASRRVDEAVPRDDWEREKWKILAEFEETLTTTRTDLRAANEEVVSAGAKMDSNGESVRAALRSLTASFDSGESGWQELTRTRAALLGNCEDVSRRVLDAEWSLNVTQGLLADSTKAEDSNSADSTNRARKAAAQWRQVLESRELDASSKARLEKLTSTSALVDAQLSQLSLVLKHRRALDEKVCNRPSAASLIVNRRGSPHGSAKKKADSATFFRRLRATYEAARVLHENTVPKLKTRVDRLSSAAASTPRSKPKAFSSLLSEGAKRTAYQEDKYEQQLSRLLASATRLTPTPRDERPSKLFWSPSSRGGAPGSSTTSSRLNATIEAPPIALGDETLRGASSVLFSKWSDVKREVPPQASTTTPAKSTTLAATPIEKTPKTRLFGSTTKTEEESVLSSAKPQEFSFGQARIDDSTTKLTAIEDTASGSGFSFGGGSNTDVFGKKAADTEKEPNIFQAPKPAAPSFVAPQPKETVESSKSAPAMPEEVEKESKQVSAFGSLSFSVPPAETPKAEVERKKQPESASAEIKAVPAPIFAGEAAAPSPAATATPFGTEGKSLSRQESMIGGYQTQQQDPSIDYRAALVEIYQKHAPDKLANVDKYLQKYKGREPELMAQLRKKYLSGGTTAPFGAAPVPAPASNNAFGQPFGGTSTSTTSPFSSSSANIQASSGMSMTPSKPDAAPTKPLFGGQHMDPGGVNNDMRDDAQQQQQQQQNSPFGGAAPQQNAFGSSTTTTSPFGGGNAFGTAASPSPFGGAATQQAPRMSGGGIFGGGMQPQGDIRSQVVAIYQRVDPSKLDKVDQFLAKYKGREAELLAQLNKKYAGKLGGVVGAPSSVPAGGGTTTAAFGAPTQLGGGAPAFSSQSQAPAVTSSFASYSSLGAKFGSPSNLGAAPFGSQPLPAQNGNVGGFGSTFGASSTPGASAFGGGMAQAPSSFGGATMSVSATNNASPFGQQQQNSPFGGQMQRQNSPFGGVPQQPSPFGAPQQGSFGGAAPSPQQGFQSQQPSLFGGSVNATTTPPSAGFGGFGGGQQQGGGGFGQPSFGQSSSFTQMRG